MSHSYWIILENPFKKSPRSSSETTSIQRSSLDIPQDISKMSFTSRMRNFPKALRYVVPLLLVYYFEYMINQGLVS